MFPKVLLIDFWLIGLELFLLQVQKICQKKIKVPGDLKRKQSYNDDQGLKLGNEGFLPVCDLGLTLSKKNENHKVVVF